MIGKDLVAASSKPLILSILGDGENYGYAILRRVHELSSEQIEWTEGMLYPVLHRLEQEGLIRARWAKVESGRERKYYRLSRKGHKMLETEKGQWLAVHNTLCKLWSLRPTSI
jgi:DNA-binding PadR family transcriptional regulator